MSNLPPLPRSRFSHGPNAASSGQPLVPPSAMFLALVTVVSPSPDGVGSLALIPSYGHCVNEDADPLPESLEPAPRMDKGKQPAEKGFQLKRRRAVSIESDESILEEGLMADARCVGREEEFFRINQGTDPTSRLVDVVDRCRQLPLRLRLLVQ